MGKPTSEEIAAAAEELRSKKDAWEVARAAENDAQQAMLEASVAYDKVTKALVTED